MNITLPVINYPIPANIELKPARSGHTVATVRRAGDVPLICVYFVFKPFDEWAALSDDDYLMYARLLRVSVWELREAVKALEAADHR